MFRWKRNSHRLGKLAYSAVFLAAGAFIAFVPTHLNLIYRLIAGALVAAVGVAVYFSPTLRIYFQMQFLGAETQSVEDVVSKYTLLERDAACVSHSCCCLVEARVEKVFSCKCSSRRWQAVELASMAFALFPGVVVLKDAVVMEMHAAAVFVDGSWIPTEMVLLGNVNEAAQQLEQLTESHGQSKMERPCDDVGRHST